MLSLTVEKYSKEMFKKKYFIETGVWKVIMKPVFEVTVVDLHVWQLDSVFWNTEFQLIP